MKVRIIQKDNFWYGEVYGDWNCLLLNTKWTGWLAVTSRKLYKIRSKI